MDFYDLTNSDTAVNIKRLLAKRKGILGNGTQIKIVMLLETSSYLHRLEANQFSIFTQKFHKSISKTLKHFEGEVVKKDDHTYLVVFTTATNAVLCALKIQANFKYITPKFDKDGRQLKIGISSLDADREKSNATFEAITGASRMCAFVANQLVISQGVKVLYENENRNARIDRELIRILKPREESFLTRLIVCCEKMSTKSNFNVSTLGTELGLGRSQLYRKVIRLTRKSPSTFIREFRLRRAIGFLHEHMHDTISQIAVESGFKSPTYFSRCFNIRFGILPSKYIQQHTY
ncbi:MAG: helix-turn-helix domain-containing protein [Maribacter sp.]|nr:helix-turn-helix domain-containing protein [Maribacter sp.]